MKRNIQGQSKQIEWTFCFICQRKDTNDLRSSEASLKTLAENLQQFYDLGKLDLEWESIANVDSGELNLFESLKQNGAQFHHKCASKYNKQKIERIVEAQRKQSLEKKGPAVTRSSVEKKQFASIFCAICSKPDTVDNLHAAGSLHATKSDVNVKHNDEMTIKWKSMAMKVGNESLLSLLSSGDLASNELYYHGECNISMWNECKRIDRANSKEIESNWKKAQAFDKVVNYVIEKESADPGSVFIVKDLNNMYIENLKVYGIEEQCQTTRFTQKLVTYIPNLFSRIIDRKTVVLFDEKVHELVSDYVSCPDDFFASLRKVVHPIRADMNDQSNEFVGYFDGASQVNSVPRTLLVLTSALIDGNNSNVNEFSQEALTTAQLIMSHARNPGKKSRKNEGTKTVVRRHTKSRETPITQYVGLKIYSITRSRALIDSFFRAGLCVSYDRVLEITKILYDNLRESYSQHGCFFPRILKKGLFSVWLKDNVDVNPKTNFAKMSYHGTSSSLIQFVTDKDVGIDFPSSKISNEVSPGSKKLSPLPAEYTKVENLFSIRSDSSKLWAPLCSTFSDFTEFVTLNNAIVDELSWLKTFNVLINSNSEECVTLPPGWATHHASQKRGFHHPPGINTILPLLRDKVNTLNTQGHLMSMNIKWTEILNPGQTPVDVSDQPVYALTKELQFRYPEKFSKYFPIFGQLHIEQSLLVVHGQLINGSGLPEILTQHTFSMIGLSAVVDVNNIKRARYCLQVTLCALYTKLQEAAAQSTTDLSPYEWLCKQSDESDVFFFWKMVIDLEINILIYVRSIREGNFKLYVEVLRKLLKWYFIFDHYNYARWLTIHWFDLSTLNTSFPDVFEYLTRGYFSFQKTNREFSRMGLDQLHEQNNCIIKGCGGATDLVNKIDDSALVRWETCGSDIARLVTEFENIMEPEVLSGVSRTKHHEDNDAFQKRFASDVKTLCKGLVVNPFQQVKLAKVNNCNLVVPDSSIETIKNMETKGEEQVTNFINDRLVSQKVSICETIVKNKYNIWNVTQSKKDTQFTPTNSVLNKMRSAYEHRSGMAKMLFDQEILNVPQSLSTDGVSMYHGSKSDIAKRLTTYSYLSISSRVCDSAMIIEMSPIIRAKAFSSSGAACFSDFAVLLYYEVMKLASSYDRIDVVFDRYFDRSLKEETRKGRGLGSRFVFEGDSPIPNNMAEGFMKNSENKNELNEYLAKKFIELHQNPKLLIVTWKDTVICSSNSEPINQPDVSITKCQSEEADQRLVRHVLHCLDNYIPYKRIVIRTIDTDVLILLISYVSQLPEIVSDLDVFAYLINSKKYFNIIEVISSLGLDVCLALPFFYAFTGCDTVSSFHGKGKCKAWDAWFNSQKKDVLTTTFADLGNKPTGISSEKIDVLEEFVQNLYAAQSDSLGATRVEKFIKSAENDLRKLPPSKEALIQHTKRACYQAGYLWRECIEDCDLPDPKSWGWTTDENENYIPLWQTIQSAADLNTFITTCTCKTQKCKNCKCSRADIPCISMCGCSRKCISE